MGVAGHDYGNTRFSPLKQINAENAGKLSLAYSFSLDRYDRTKRRRSSSAIRSTFRLRGVPNMSTRLTPTGARKWTYEPEISMMRCSTPAAT